METQSKRLFFILCNHRSGSSATSGVLYHLGIHMGEHLLGSDISNPKGHFENVKFVELNDMILKSVGSDWATPPSRAAIMSSDFPHEQVYSFLKNHAKSVWGLKDPRTALTFDIWKLYLEEIANITFIFVWRSIEESIHSLAQRNNFTMDKARTILESYHTNLKQFRSELEQERKDIIDIHFSDLLEKPEEFVKEINVRINQKSDEKIDIVKQFLDVKLKHF
jgi:hypothetical protein